MSRYPKTVFVYPNVADVRQTAEGEFILLVYNFGDVARFRSIKAAVMYLHAEFLIS